MAQSHVIIVGCGPAGMMAGYLFARAGVAATVLEKHGDFLRDFRGDTVHPSTLDILDELGLLDAFLKRPHDRVERVGAWVGGRHYGVADFRHLPRPGRFIAMMPQWEFLDFLAGAARELNGFNLRMHTEAVSLSMAAGRVCGVVTAAGEVLGGDLVIAADGRRSVLRDAARLPLVDLGAPIDVLWFRVPKSITADNRTAAFIGSSEMVVTIDRGDYYQCARLIPKGGADAIRAGGIEQFRHDVAATAPMLADGLAALTSWDEVKLLSVALDRLAQWSRPGLLAIGDAAHAMSPVGGVGINLAIQDAVAAANILAAPLARGDAPDALLARVQRRREGPVRIIQALQRAAHRNVIGAALDGRLRRAPALLRALDRFPRLQRLPGRLLGLGIRRERVRSPVAGSSAPR